MKWIQLGILAMGLALSSPAMACANAVTEFLKDGSPVYSDPAELGGRPWGHMFEEKSSLNRTLKSLERKYIQTKDLDYRSDQGYVLIVLGRYQEAVDLYLDIESKKPNRYATASNLGTAYELLGDNQNALKWIEKGNRLNPKSHQSSEWIHVNILKAKLSGKIGSRELLGTDFGNDAKPKTNKSEAQLSDLRDQIFAQLQERVSFVKPKDPIVAQLMFDLANVYYLEDQAWSADGTYEGAQDYGYTGSLLKARRDLIKRRQAELDASNPLAGLPSQAVPSEEELNPSLSDRIDYVLTHLSETQVNAIKACILGGMGILILLTVRWFRRRKR